MKITIHDIEYQEADHKTCKVTLHDGSRLNFCSACGMLNPRLFMLHDRLWNEAVGKPNRGTILCLECTEHNLGHPIGRISLTPAPINYDFDRKVWLWDQADDMLLSRLLKGGAMRTVAQIVRRLTVVEQMAILASNHIKPYATPAEIERQTINHIVGANHHVCTPYQDQLQGLQRGICDTPKADVGEHSVHPGRKVGKDRKEKENAPRRKKPATGVHHGNVRVAIGNRQNGD
jgi:hypothetical protein